MTEQDDLTPDEATALRGLAAGPEPPASLEQAAVERLRARGLIAPRKRGRLPWLGAAAAAVALFAAGLYVGSRRPEAPVPAASTHPRYVLFLYDAPEEAALSSADIARRVDEYRNWARGVRRAGGDIRGEKLASETRRLGPNSGDSVGVLGGYFVVSARDYEAAVAIARSCPHLRYGGTIEVRPIEKT